MNSKAADPSLCHELGETLGRLREASAALFNVHVLLASSRVGPRALESVLRDTEKTLLSAADAAKSLDSLLQQTGLAWEGPLRISEDVDAFLRRTQAVLQNFSPAQARSRLKLEQTLFSSRTELKALVAQFDFLADARTARPALLSLVDLLSSHTTKSDSDDTFAVTLSGADPALRREVELPVRATLLAVGVLLKRHVPQEEGLHLNVEASSNHVSLHASRDTGASPLLSVLLPGFPGQGPDLRIVEAALLSHGVTLEGATLRVSTAHLAGLTSES